MSITCSSCIVGLVFCFYSIWALSFVPVGCVGLVFRVCWLWVLFTISPIKITSFFYCTCGQWDTFTSGPIKKNLLSLWAFCLLDRCDVRHHIYLLQNSQIPLKKKVNSQIQLILQAHLGHHHNYLSVLIAHLDDGSWAKAMIVAGATKQKKKRMEQVLIWWCCLNKMLEKIITCH